MLNKFYSNKLFKTYWGRLRISSKLRSIFLKKIDYLYQNLIKFLELQLFLNLVSWPILLNWGLPVSLLSVVGNFVFTPVLSIFILFSCLIFFTEILYIPNYYLIFVLDKLTNLWAYSLSFGSEKVLLPVIKPPIIFSVTIIFLAFYILTNKTYFKSSKNKILGFLLVFIMGFIFLNYFYKSKKIIKLIPIGSKTAKILHENNKTTLIFDSVIKSRGSYKSWVNYKLVPELVKSIGSLKIDKLVVVYPTPYLLNISKVLVQKNMVKNITLPPYNPNKLVLVQELLRL